ncbi:cell division inhibitor SulA [Gilvimarinus sp. DA14]|uniref:cell division inhibitor SulA n=1 Tax=Gilvimarinus sp. DA14 TaxID=2956798 RepID=UPI0020B6C92F|nr:hypothetical protein [Gilvimarinus sp. DA14]UTF60942.1 hypothetical protein NHM04_03845 [Gilvimarinus sp. DA14]
MTKFNTVQPIAQPDSGLTELVLTQGAGQSWHMVLPMIAHLSHQCDQRWLTWVTREPVPSHLLAQFNVDTSHLRLVHCKDDEQQLWVSWDALALGNSHTVIASPGKLNRQEFAQLERAAQLGACQGLLIRER